MHKPIRLLVLIDFSDYADSLILLAYEFSMKWNCKVTFLHQVPGLVPVLADSESKSEILQIEKERADIRLKLLVKNKYPLLNAAYIITEKDLLETIKAQEHSNYQYWIMTGLKGTGMLKKVLVGSTTTKLVDETDLPLITVPLSTEICLPKNIICSVSYKYPVKEDKMIYMLEKLMLSPGGLKLVTVVTDDDDEQRSAEYLGHIALLTASYQPEVDLLKGENALDELKNIVVTSPSAYLMLQQGSRHLSDMFFRKFMINELVYHGKIPLIIIPL